MEQKNKLHPFRHSLRKSRVLRCNQQIHDVKSRCTVSENYVTIGPGGPLIRHRWKALWSAATHLMQSDEILQVAPLALVQGAAWIHPLNYGCHVSEHYGVHKGWAVANGACVVWWKKLKGKSRGKLLIGNETTGSVKYIYFSLRVNPADSDKGRDRLRNERVDRPNRACLLASKQRNGFGGGVEKGGRLVVVPVYNNYVRTPSRSRPTRVEIDTTALTNRFAPAEPVPCRLWRENLTNSLPRRDREPPGLGRAHGDKGNNFELCQPTAARKTSLGQSISRIQSCGFRVGDLIWFFVSLDPPIRHLFVDALCATDSSPGQTSNLLCLGRRVRRWKDGVRWVTF